jgi:sulfur carrier protein
VNAAPTLGIILNGQPHGLDGPTTLHALLTHQGLSERKGLAAAVNGEVVPRSEWSKRLLAERDRVLVIRATQGG